METIVPVALFLSLTVIILGLARIISEARTRRLLLQSGASAEAAAAMIAATRQDPGLYPALKWGLVTIAVGIALIIVQFIPYQPDDPIVVGVVLVFGGAALLAYYLAARRLVSQPTSV